MAEKRTAKRDSTSDSEVTARLCRDVASAFDAYSQIKQAHWTVVGSNFIALHELFDVQANLMRGHVDTLAERVRALGAVPEGTIRQAAQATQLPDFPKGEIPSNDAVTEIANRYAELSEQFHESAGVASEAEDIATEDVYIEIIRDLDLQRWFLLSHLG